MKKRVIALALIFTLMLGGCAKAPQAESNVLAEAAYPVSVKYPDQESFENWDEYNKEYDKWYDATRAVRELETDDTGIRGYVEKTVGEILNDNGENIVYSPANVYFALAMLAEVTDNDTRAQVLELLGYDSIGPLRTNTKNLWQKLYKNDGLTTSVLANSLWLTNEYQYNADTVNILKEHYFASSYSGDFTDAAYTQALRDWINEQTGGLLKEQANALEFKPETVFALVSTIYYKARWVDKFSETATKKDTFHTPTGDVTVDFMHSGRERMYYYSDKFCATSAPLDGGGTMYMILPDNGVSVSDVLKQEDCIDLISGNEDGVKSKYTIVNLALPKFDVSSDLSLVDPLKKLGITYAFDVGVSDFTPVTDDVAIELSKVDHAARVKVNEEGCEAAAYTVIAAEAGAMPPDDEVDLVLDRPFIFAITGSDGLPRFAGIVNNP